MDFTLITTQSAWQACLDHLLQQSRLAIDLEANSMHAYREEICLIQISTETRDFIVDPLANIDLTPMEGLLGDTAVEKVFHAAEYDLILMTRQFGWELNNLFDTMWAARILGYPRYGLASLLEEFYDVQLDKRYQKANWCKRPLSDEHLEYAQHDTHHLLRLRDKLANELEQAERMEEAKLIFAEQTQVKLPDTDFDPDGFWSLRGVQDLSNRQLAVLKALYNYRDQQASQRDQPLFKIMGDRTLVEIARRIPQNSGQLEAIRGMSKGQMRRYGRQLLEIVQRAKHAPTPTPPKRSKRPPEEVINRYERLHLWRKLRAQARGVESDVIISRDALWAIAAKNPQSLDALVEIPMVGALRGELYGDEILTTLQETA